MKKRLTSVLMTFLACPVYAQLELSVNSQDEVELSRALLNEQQNDYGPMDVRLVEPLEQLADQLMLQNQFDEAHALLDRAMQITRIEEGLYTEIQRPLLEKKIENFAKQGDWESARGNMEHLLWLYTNQSTFLNEALIDDLLELSRIHLRALAEDDSAWQAYHFAQSDRIRWVAIGVGRALWGEADERLVPIIYEHLRQFHLQAVALNHGGLTSYALRKISPTSGFMRERSDVNEGYYLAGLSLIDNLFSIYSKGESMNAESLAMTRVYLADWQILFGQPQAAIENYQRAHQKLIDSGVTVSLVNEFFSQPMVIPATEFYPNVEAGVLAQRNKMINVGEGDSSAYLSFSEWSVSLPNVRNPIPNGAADARPLDSNFALFSFSLAGVNKVSRWFSHRFSTTVNMIEEAEILAHYLEFPPEQGQLLEKLTSLTFRPKLVDGEPQPARGRLKYEFAVDGRISQ